MLNQGHKLTTILSRVRSTQPAAELKRPEVASKWAKDLGLMWKMVLIWGGGGGGGA